MLGAASPRWSERLLHRRVSAAENFTAKPAENYRELDADGDWQKLRRSAFTADDVQARFDEDTEAGQRNVQPGADVPAEFSVRFVAQHTAGPCAFRVVQTQAADEVSHRHRGAGECRVGRQRQYPLLGIRGALELVLVEHAFDARADGRKRGLYAETDGGMVACLEAITRVSNGHRRSGSEDQRCLRLNGRRDENHCCCENGASQHFHVFLRVGCDEDG